jgi:predicted RNA binding protein YcfA (HicA-like mRNA interferase family)
MDGSILEHLRSRRGEGVRARWQRMGQVGSHLVMVKAGARANLSLPQHRELSIGTLRALVRNAGMTVDEFLGFL